MMGVAQHPRRQRRAAATPRPVTASYDVTTVKGVPLRIDVRENIEDRINPGWVVHLLTADRPEGPAGYLKVSYIPREQAEALYPDPFAWQSRDQLGLEDTLGVPDDLWTREQIIFALRASQRHFSASEVDDLADHELLAHWKQRRAQYNEENRHVYEAPMGLDFHVDKPLVDYISVYREGDSPHDISGRVSDDAPRVTVGSRGTGAGTALYETAALWIAERGMQLHASGLQSDEAQAAWARFRKRGVVIEKPCVDRVRQVLDIDAIRAGR